MAAQAVAALQRANKILPSTVATAVLLGLVYLLMLLRSLFTLDPDFGWHLSSGQYILTNGLPQTDIYTYTAADFPWIHHEWLADVINAAIYNLGGTPLLAAVFAGLWTLAVWLMVGKQNWRGALSALVAVIAIAQFIAIRDTAWTALLLAATHRIYDRNRAYVPLLFIAWANLHGGFVIGFAYILWRNLYERRWKDIWLFIAAVGATLLNPYGIGLYREILATLLDPTLHNKVSEWQRFGIDITMIILPLIWLVPIVSDLYKKRWRGIVRFDVFLLLASFISLRHFLLFGLFSLPRITAFYSQVQLPRKHIQEKVFTFKRILYIFSIQLTGLIGLACLVAACITALREPLRFMPENNPPVVAVNSLRQRPCGGNLFNHYNIGGYLIWQLPEQKVYIDGRMPSWQHNGVNYMADYLKVTNDEAFQKQQFNKHQIECAVVESGSRLATSLKSQGWDDEVDKQSDWVLLRK